MKFHLIAVVLCVVAMSASQDVEDVVGAERTVSEDTDEDTDSLIRPQEKWQREIFENWKPEYGNVPWVYSNQIEGDIVPTPGSFGRYGMKDPRYRWKDATLVYSFDSTFSSTQRNIMLNAMGEISRRTCVKFRPRTRADTDYVSITAKAAGCYAHVGRIGGKQELNLEPNKGPSAFGCMYHEVALHEFMHAIGFIHEHTAPDRDQYITIFSANIEANAGDVNFQKAKDSEVTNFGVPYHYTSIMHYDSTAFSKNGRPTMLPTRSGVNVATMGTSLNLTSGDVTRVNKMYGCS